MPEPFVQQYRARWVDMDYNQHMRNAAFLGCAEETRLRYMQENGWTMAELMRNGIGPVALEDRLVYRRELKLLEPFCVDVMLAGATANASRLRIQNRIIREADGTLCATVHSHILWLDLAQRRPVAPPEPLAALWLAVPRTEDFHDMTSS